MKKNTSEYVLSITLGVSVFAFGIIILLDNEWSGWVLCFIGSIFIASGLVQRCNP